MDAISALITHIDLQKQESVPPPPSPEFNSTITTQQQHLPDITNTLTDDIPPPQFSNSINELRSFSSALSAFLGRYDELQNHISFIKLSIDSKLSSFLVDDTNPSQSALARLSETSCNQTFTGFSKVVASEGNPRDSVRDYERGHAIERTVESTLCSHDSDEIGTSKTPEIVDVSKNTGGIDVFKKAVVIDVLKKHVQTGTLKNLEEIDIVKNPEETVAETSCVETITAVPEGIVSEQNPNGVANNCERNHEIEKTPERLEKIDVLKNPEVMDTSKKPQQTDIGKSLEEMDASMDPVEIETVKKPEEIDILEKPQQTDICKSLEEIDTSMDPVEIETVKKPEETNVLKKKPKVTENKKSIVSVLEFFCQNMYSEEMLRHVTEYFSEMSKLQTEIAKALKLAADPAKLVLDSIGSFFVQGSRTFCKDSHQTVVRLALVLILECFVMISSDGIEIANTEKKHAAETAADWRDRMIKEGGLRQTDEIDARGLLLFISGFGILDDVFKIQDITDLIRASNVKEISNALCCSVFLTPKIPEVIDLMVKNNLEIEAADIAYAFRLDDKCHPQNILRTYLHNLVKDIQNDSSFPTFDAMKQQLFDLKSVKQCLESQYADPLMHLPDFKINVTIQNLEKEINQGELIHKRKSLENPTHQEAKRLCVIHENTPRQHKPVDQHSMSPNNQSTQPSSHSDISDHTENMTLTNTIDVSKKAVEIDTSKNPEVVDVSTKAVEIDVSKNREEINLPNHQVEIYVSKNLKEVDVLKKHAETDILKKAEETVAEPSCFETRTTDPEATVSEQNHNRMATNCKQGHENVRTPEANNVLRKCKESETSKRSVISVLESLCQNMCYKGMRRHIKKHYSEMSKLQKEIEKALKLAKDPAKLVLNSISRFYVLDRKEFFKCSSHSAERQATVLILECFVMISSDGTEIAKREKVQAAKVANNWRKRMIKCGLRQADEVDARGLLLFISGFGIQDQVFKIQDIVDLIRASNMKRISTALRCSVFLKPKIPEVIDLMVTKNMVIEAADIAFTFGLEDKRHPRNILRTYLHSLVKDIRNVSSYQTLEAMKQQVSDLKSVKQYLESHDTDPSMLRDFKVNERIQNLEKEIKLEESTQKKKSLKTDVSKKAEETVTETSKRSVISVLESLCENMCSKDMRRHIAKHYSEMRKLHKEIEKAFKLAKDPAKLVLDSIGRIFLQGSRTFRKESPQTVLKLASVLILECFVTISSTGIKIAKPEKEYAAEAAADWRKRMIKEGGLRRTDELDARGLLLFISGFGIQDDVFKIRDITDLIRACNVKGISAALSRSVFLIPKLPEVIDLMVKNNLEIEAVDIAYTFGLENMCRAQNILRTYLLNLVKDIQHSPSLQTLEAMKQQLYDLKTVKQCLESHNVDPSILLPDLKIDEMIEFLVKEVNIERLMILKRKPLENSQAKQQAKRACFDHENMPRQHKPIVDHHGMSPYNRSTRSTQPDIRYVKYSENIDGSMPNGSAYGVPGSYDQTVHIRVDVPSYGWHGPNGQHYSRHDQTYDSQPYRRQREWGPPEPFLDVSSGRWASREPFPRRVGPPEPYREVEDYPPPGGFSRRRGPSADLYGFANKV